MYDLLAIGTSAGGIEAMKTLLAGLDRPLPFPVVIVQHLEPTSKSFLPQILEKASGIPGYEATDKGLLIPDCFYCAAPNYHVILEKDWTLTLTVEERVSYARPSIDVLFDSVADGLKERAIGVLLTGANHDGASGLRNIHEQGGYTIVQSPEEAFAKEMPSAALKLFEPDLTAPLIEIRERINQLMSEERTRDEG